MWQQSVITIGIDPSIELGPLTVTWHGLMIAVGIATGGWLAASYARERGLDRETVLNLVLVIALAGIAGARLLYLAQNDAGALVRPGDWFESEGFSFYGALILGTAAVVAYLWRAGLDLRYLDALAAGFPLGMAIGRVGDLINGEHYGPASDLPWAIRHTSPDAEVPSSVVAYHSGGLYEIVLALLMLAVIWPLRHRFQRPAMLLWTVIALYSAGRIAMFFVRSDSETLALGLDETQWISIGLLGIATLGAWVVSRTHRPRLSGPTQQERSRSTSDSRVDEAESKQ
jgi:phosphatidylglycerol:prolipoprotein diacylglycerol transferase